MNFQSQLVTLLAPKKVAQQPLLHQKTTRKTTSSTLKTFFNLPSYPKKNPTVRGWVGRSNVYIYTYICTYIYTPIIHPQEFITQFSHAAAEVPRLDCQRDKRLELAPPEPDDVSESSFQTVLHSPKMACW